MTPEQALQLLDNVVEPLNRNRRVHVGMVQSIQTLNEALQELLVLKASKAEAEAKAETEAKKSSKSDRAAPKD